MKNVSFAAVGNTNTVTISWNSLDTNATSFEVSYATNIAASFLPLTNVPAVYPTNWSTNYQFTAQFQVVPGPYFFVVQGSNFWGYGQTSNVPWTPPAPTVPVATISRP